MTLPLPLPEPPKWKFEFDLDAEAHPLPGDLTAISPSKTQTQLKLFYRGELVFHLDHRGYPTADYVLFFKAIDDRHPIEVLMEDANQEVKS